MDILCFYFLRLLCLCACLFICALWSPAGKGQTSWLSFVMSNCKFVTFICLSFLMGMGNSSALIAGTIPRTTLYNITSLVSRRRCCKIGNVRSSNIGVTHPSNLDL